MNSWPRSDLATYTARPATFEFDQTSPGAVALTGILYRAIPHSSQEPLNTSQSLIAGGRWNRPGSFPVLYTGASVDVVRSFVEWHAVYFGLPLRTRPTDDLPDLIVVSFNATVANAVTDEGLVHYRLPTNYPTGFPPQEHTATRAVGQAVFEAGLAGVAARSATMANWTGPIASWADVAIFTGQAPEPALVDRFRYDEWYSGD